MRRFLFSLFFLLNYCLGQIPCNSWLHIPNYNTQDYIAIGDLDMTGNSITVEALFAAESNYFIPSTVSYDLVSKHTDPSNCNYLLRPVHVGITTTNGFFDIASCDYKPRKINHAALVYDGSTLKFYRNGFLMGSKPASGNLVTNDLITKIGNYADGNDNGSLKGYMNEVRIWNIARTENEIKTYMNAPLPNPTTQTGLVAYYQFDNLNNKQGNALWNGALNGAATINNTVPDCNFFPDSCIVITQQQTCSGSFGNPVVNITFGSGASNPGPQISAVIPGATTNYNFASYATGNPPAAAIDGDYALVNSVPVNGAWYTGASDHTGNVNGYMAFFNSAPTPGEFYRQTVSNLCPGTTYEFSAWVANVLNPSVIPAAILPNITFKILDPVTQSTLASFNSGDIAMENSMTWKQNSFLFTLPITNTSVTLVIANNNIGGNTQPGNDLAIDDITFRPCGPLTKASFSFSQDVDSIGPTSCAGVEIYGSITGSFNNPAYQWQISDDGGVTYSDIPGANTLIAMTGSLTNGQYLVRMLSAEAGNINSPNCRFISNILKMTVGDCPSSTTGIQAIINYYTPVISFNPCDNKITVEDGSGFKVGDTVLMIQMKGAIIDSSNTAAFGTITNYKNAGNYEFNYVKSVNGSIVELKNILQRQYDIPVGKVQLIRVPFYKSVVVIDTLTCLPWDGRKGGVLVFNVQDTLELNADINVTGRGFLKGVTRNSNFNGFTCGINDSYYPDNTIHAAGKGEGITALSSNRNSGKGPAANGGGGGMDTNSGGAGGSNGNAGGRGGDELNICPNHTTSQNWGLPGTILNYSNSENKIFMGGGGGAGHCNNQFYDPSVNADFNGGNGGGIVIINSDVIKNNGKNVISKGDAAYELNIPNSFVSHDGIGGGGAGGTILLNNNTYTSSITIDVSGGRGGNMFSMPAGGLIGPGGGGSGGVVWIKQNSVPAVLNITNAGGTGGVITQNGNDPYGAEAGLAGINVFSLAVPIDIIPFKPNIDSVRIRDSVTSCLAIGFKGLPYTNTHPIQSWQWSFGDNTSASTQNTSHTYSNAGNYTVKVVATDINGCKDSTTKTITVASCQDTIINSYAAVLTIDICNNTLTVDDPAKFNAGDTIVIMQMKGAAIDSLNTINFGTIINYNNAGKFEFNYVKSKTGNTIEFKNTFLNNYDAAFGRVQLIRVPYFQSFTVNNKLTCPAWDGAKGGVLILNSATTVTLNDTIDVSYKGFRGGAVGGGFSCGNVSDWCGPTGMGGTKGEGITEYITGFEAGGARLANGGGGAYAANSGGGGGGNFGVGGLGGFHSNTCPTPTQSMDGHAVTYMNTGRVCLGGGGGGGQQDNGQPVSPGGNGGGIVIIKAQTIFGNSQLISVDGEDVTTLVRDEGGAGGGAGGSVLLFTNNINGLLKIGLEGGDGSSNDNQLYPTRCHGPGGGGGGGYLGYSLPASSPFTVSENGSGGRAGFILNAASACFNTTGGATDGTAGGINFDLVIPEATVPFKKNIDSVRINETLTSCKTFDFNGIAYTNTSAIQKWEWNFDNASTTNGQNTSYTYPNYGPHTVKLVATDINGCKDSVSKVVTTNGINFDFVFEQDVCNPLNVRFKAVGDTTAEIYWNKGDGTVITTIRNPTHQYANPGSYLIEYCTGNASTGCIDTVRKTIYIGWINANIILTPDTTICFGTSKLLRSSIDSTLGFCWSPVSFLNNPNLANPTTSTPSNITYQLLAVNEENNLIPNGDFSTGNVLFTSDYTEGTAPLSSTEYFISTSSVNAGPSAATCNDHTTGTGNMMVVRNDFGAKAQVWAQTVNITPNTTYTFSAWFQSLFATSNAQLQLSINGNAVKDSIALSATTCTWQKHSVIWNSGPSTTANFAIMSMANTSGNDDYFTIDDIKLAPYSIEQDTVRISVDTPFIDTRADTSICESIAVTLNTSSAVIYSWTPATGLSSTSAANPVATPTDTTKYFVTGTNAFGCQATDSVTIAVKPKPFVTSTGDTLICRNTSATLFATGGGSYFWSPATSLDNPVSTNPITNPTTVNTKYVVVVIGVNNCISKDSFTVTVTPIPTFTISADKSVCLNAKPQLNATGGNFYLWSPSSLVSNPNISNPLALTNNTTLYSVLIKDTTCGDATTLTTNIIILPKPTVTAAKENDINCAIGSTVLKAGGALQYAWSPTNTLDNATSAKPIASPVNTTTYTVTGTDANGCSNTASVTVLTDYSTRVNYEIPNAFTPNADGHNDCFRVKYFGLIQDLQFVIYNRWGEKVFFTTNPNDCWDGTYKGNPCDPGNFVYHIKAKTTCGPVERKGNVLLVR